MKRLFLVYVVLLHLAIGGLLWLRYRSIEPPIIETMREVHRQMDDSIPAGAAIFLGDSITMGLATSAVAPVSVNYGIGYQRSDQLVESMKLYRSLSRASAVYIAIGMNDLLQDMEPDYPSVLAAVPAGVPVVLSSVTPSPRFNPRWARNAAEAACAARPGCVFVDLLALNPELLPDGVHLTAKGYAVWIAALLDTQRPAH